MKGNGNGKTGGKTGHFANGDDPRRGYGKPGRSGRKRLEFVEACETLVDHAVLPKIQTYLQTHKADDPAWRWCAEYVSKYTKSEPPKRQVVIGDAELPVVFKLDLNAASLSRLRE